jgi:fatty acid desaturase
MSEVLVDRRNLAAFTAINDRIAVLMIIADYAMVIGVIVLAVIANHPLVTVLALPLIAGRQIAFLNLLHAAAHHSLFSNKRANDRADILIGYLIFDSVRLFRSYHLQHHRAFARKDPDRFEYLEDRLRRYDDGRWRRTWEVIVKPLLGGEGVSFIRFTIDQARENPWWAWRLGAYWIVVAAICSWAGWFGYLLFYWIFPMVWLYPVFYNWSEITDHYAVEDGTRNQRGLFYSLFLKGHEMYHAVHHRYPRIPFYRVNAACIHLRSTGEQFEETRGVVDFVRILYRRTSVRSHGV